MKTPDEIREWRRTVRAELLAKRRAMSHDERQRSGLRVNARVREEFSDLRTDSVGFYLPIRGEIDLRPLAAELAESGIETSVPVITARSQPLSFARWHSAIEMVPGVWNIPVPADPQWVQPAVLLVPVLGFDQECYRLGYGGGYYDRTLGAMNPKPWTIGVGYESGRLETIFPQEYDLPLDAIVTESSVTRSKAT